MAVCFLLLALTIVGVFLLVKSKRSNEPDNRSNQKTVYTLGENISGEEEPITPPDIAAKPKKLSYSYGVDDSTGQGDVRSATAKTGVDYKVSERAFVGVEAGRKIHDTQDAAAWNRKVEDENEAQVKYKLAF